MRPVSEQFRRVVRGSHAMAARARLVAPGQTGTDPAGTVVPILAGNVELDATADVRSTLDLTTRHPWPATAADPLAPYGQEAFIERGIRLGNGAVEWVSLGYHRIETIEEDETLGGPGAVRVTASDRMEAVRSSELPAPRQYAATTTLGNVVADLVTEALPDVVIEWDDPTVQASTLGRTVIAERNRQEFLADLLAAHAKVGYFDHRGVLVVRDVPDATEPVAEFNTGPGGIVVSLSRSLTRKGVANGVVATGEAPGGGAPAYALVVDANPASPTRWGGPFGKVPRFYSSPLLTTNGQAAKAARTILGRDLGLPYSIDMEAVPDPSLEPLDPIAVTHPDGTTETHVITGLRIDLTHAGGLTVTTREQTRTLIAETTS